MFTQEKEKLRRLAVIGGDGPAVPECAGIPPWRDFHRPAARLPQAD